MKTCFTVAIILCFAITAWPQERISKVVPRTYSLRIPQMDKGTVEGRTYRNPSIGLEFTPPVGLTFGTPELKGTPGTVPLLVAVAAWGEQRWDSPREGAIFYAEALAYYPDEQHSTEGYVRMVVRGNRQEGFEPVGESLDAKLGGVSFSRTDFKKSPVYEAVLVKACAAQAFVFIFAGSDQDAVNKLISGTEVNLDDSRSGCSPGTSDTKKMNPPPTGFTIKSHTPSANPGPNDGGGVRGKIYSVRAGVSAPVPIFRPQPEYSKEARKAKLQGTVVVSIVIDATGAVTNCKVVKSVGLGLDEKAVETVKTWKFKPSLKNGLPVAVRVLVEVSFRL